MSNKEFILIEITLLTTTVQSLINEVRILKANKSTTLKDHDTNRNYDELYDDYDESQNETDNNNEEHDNFDDTNNIS
ncbi:29038_t:CDS:2, partial [Racocetra persica]